MCVYVGDEGASAALPCVVARTQRLRVDGRVITVVGDAGWVAVADNNKENSLEHGTDNGVEMENGSGQCATMYKDGGDMIDVLARGLQH